jgi:hypothetical protein
MGVVISTADVGEEEQRMFVESPITAQIQVKTVGQGNNAVLVPFAVANAQLVVLAVDVVDG